MKRNIYACFAFCIICSYALAQTRQKSFLVCGDSKIMLVNYNDSGDSIPEITWSYDAHQAMDLPEDYRTKKFNSMDDCKVIDGGKSILAASSSGAVGIIDRKTGKMLFYANVPMAHSIELLPGNLLVAVASTANGGNRIVLYDRNKSDVPLYYDSLYSGHGAVWDVKRKCLYTLGYDEVREYKLILNGKPSLKLVNSWNLPSKGGHDLQMSPDGNQLFLTIEHTGAWTFDIGSHTYNKTSLFTNSNIIKSVGQDKSLQCIYTIPEESWWTYHVKFSNPVRTYAFPGLHLYKARWFTE